ncbi:MAG: diguanylate cyclase [Armatimonadetes bacterium]|nr:diguanylate cyclase [Armatimonadota bacterium]
MCTVSITCLTVAFFYREAVSAIRKEADARLSDVALCASHLIDPAVHSKIRISDGERGVHYQIIQRKLKQFHKSNPSIRHIYTLVKGAKPNELKFMVDVGANPPLLAEVGLPWDVSDHPEIQKAFSRAVADPVIRRDMWGTWLSGYAPIKDSSGKTIAIIGLDMAAGQVMRSEARITLSAVVAAITAILLATILSLALSMKISKPIMQLTTATRHIADGNLDYTISVDSKDEIGSLAFNMNRMVSSLRESQASLLQRANTDGLTSLYNHRYFHERLGQELKRALRYNHPLCLIMIDLDGFKAVNDSLGHPAGDTILRNFAKLLLAEIREIDIAARYGGDEFAVILPETGLEEATQIAERVRASVERRPHLSDEAESAKGQKSGSNAHWKITLSIGIAECPRHARQRDALVSAADIAMYHAKHVSQNMVCTYDNVPGAGGSMDPCRIYTFLQSASVSTIAALATAVDAKDHYTHGHSESVARYAVGIATEIRLSQEDKFNVRIAALLHDVGKIGMPDTILNNPGQLDTHEREIIRSHPSVGERIVKQVPQLQKILPGILYHHERWDGTGYPCGLSGEKIPLPARIICVADSFDAMTSNRPYRNAMSVPQALAEIRSCAGTQFDPACVNALIRWIQSAELQAA